MPRDDTELIELLVEAIEEMVRAAQRANGARDDVFVLVRERLADVRRLLDRDRG